MDTLDDERRYVERCRAGLRRMLEGARNNVIVGETVAGDRYSAERLGRHLKSLAKELSEEPEGPPFFGRLDFERARPSTPGARTTSAGGTSPESTAARPWSSTGARRSRGPSTGRARATPRASPYAAGSAGRA
ncbi:hypothetical protein ACFQYP_23745 [Nonomuraea antimicrobica]